MNHPNCEEIYAAIAILECADIDQYQNERLQNLAQASQAAYELRHFASVRIWDAATAKLDAEGFTLDEDQSLRTDTLIILQSKDLITVPNGDGTSLAYPAYHFTARLTEDRWITSVCVHDLLFEPV